MIGFHKKDVAFLRCPTCNDKLVWRGKEHNGELLHYGVLICNHSHTWRVESGIPNLADLNQLSKKDQALDIIYDLLAPVHDHSVNYLLPILQYPDPRASRENYIKSMQLEDLASEKAPIRILEIGAGTGANIPLIRFATGYRSNVEIWALDLNSNMVKRCARIFADKDLPLLRLAKADAHQLPFPDSFFDRVLHVGGINIYRDVTQGLAEMARVAKPETPIVVVDEGLDESRENHLLHKLAFIWLTSLDEIRQAPADLIPHDCKVMDVLNVSRFYYCLVYSKVNSDAETGIRSAT